MKRTKIENQDGFTILEVMIAMIILSMSLLLLLNMAMVALDGNDWSNKTTIATQMMQQKFEELRNVPGLGSSHSGEDKVGDTKRMWTVSRAGNHLRRIDVYINWEDVRGKMKADTMTSFIRTDSI